MEFHYETFVKQKITKKQKTMVLIMFFMSIILLPILGVLTFLMRLSFVGLALICLVAWLEYKFVTNINIEYEYALTSTGHDVELEIAKIINGKKRKNIFSGDCKQFEMVAKVKGIKDCEAYRKMNRIECVRTMEEKENFFIVTNTEEGRKVIYLQLNEELKEGLRKTIPSKFFDQ